MTPPRIGALYRSNRGHGRYIVRVVAVNRHIIRLQPVGDVPTDLPTQYRKPFSLSLGFFLSAACGWRAEP